MTFVLGPSPCMLYLLCTLTHSAESATRIKFTLLRNRARVGARLGFFFDKNKASSVDFMGKLFNLLTSGGLSYAHGCFLILVYVSTKYLLYVPLYLVLVNPHLRNGLASAIGQLYAMSHECF